MDGLATEGVPVWIAGIVGAVLLIAQAAPRILGPIGTSVHDWAERRRQAAVSRDDADIAERDRQLTYLRDRLATDRAELAERDALIVEHMRWDQAALRRCGPDLGTPPPLWPAPSTNLGPTPEPPKEKP